MSFRRQIFMILSAEYQDLNVAEKLTILSKDYTIFIFKTTYSMRHFVCGKHGNTKQACPSNKELVNHGNESVTVTEQVNYASDNGENSETITDQEPKKAPDGFKAPGLSDCP